MTITIAGEKKEYAEGTTIAQIIEAEKVENPLYVTVSLMMILLIKIHLTQQQLKREILLNFFISWEEEVSNGIY